ncbi:MAG: hypothetical protein ACREU2_10310 [Steroidobacteraceae bacterium]
MSARGRRLLWFVALWALSVAVVLATAGSLRWLFARILAVAPGRLL